MSFSSCFRLWFFCYWKQISKIKIKYISVTFLPVKRSMGQTANFQFSFQLFHNSFNRQKIIVRFPDSRNKYSLENKGIYFLTLLFIQQTKWKQKIWSKKNYIIWKLVQSSRLESSLMEYVNVCGDFCSQKKCRQLRHLWNNWMFFHGPNKNTLTIAYWWWEQNVQSIMNMCLHGRSQFGFLIGHITASMFL